jgi:hypothetical protein
MPSLGRLSLLAFSEQIWASAITDTCHDTTGEQDKRTGEIGG